MHPSIFTRIFFLTLCLAALSPLVWAQGNAADQICPRLVGQSLPEVSLTSLDGELVQVADIMAEKPTVLIFYRGSWCPYCNRHLAALAELEPELLEMGYQIVAVSPDLPENLVEARDKNELHYQLYSDAQMEFADAMGLGFTVDEKTLKRYKVYGINLEKASGESHHRLPVPAVYLVNRDGLITFNYVNPNYKVRATAALIRAAAQAGLEED